MFELQTEAWRLSFVILHPNIICEPLWKELTSPPGDFRRAPPIARGRWGRVDLLRFTTANSVYIFDSWCGRPQESRNHAETSCIEDGCTVTTCTRYHKIIKIIKILSLFLVSRVMKIFQANGRTPCGTRLQEPRLAPMWWPMSMKFQRRQMGSNDIFGEILQQKCQNMMLRWCK